MLKTIFLKTLRDQRKSLLFWSIGLIALSLYITLFYPTVRNMPELNKILEQMPKGLTALLGGQILDYTSPAGFFNLELFSMMLPIMFIAFAIGLGSGAIAGEEEKGTLDFLLANPILRGRLIIEKFGAMMTAIFVLAVIFLAGMIIGIAAVNVSISLLYLAEATLSTLMLGLVFGTLAFFLGALTGNRGMSIGVASAVAVVTYFLNSLGGMVESLKPYRLLSPFYHHLEPNILVNGLDATHFLVLTGLVVIFFALSLPAFQRRDIAV